ncbi:MAG: hypothetical protein IJZ57_03190 [Clostridia bacterium]|nr:hypothetical protein [Clostridia bacterium]
MKRIISIILAITMVLGCAPVAFAGVDANESRSQIPVIRISGDGEPLYDLDGNKIFHYKDVADFVAGDSEGGEDNSEMYKAMAEKLLPTIVKGAVTDNWDDMYVALEEEISKIFENSLLDENGNVTNGSGLSQKRKNQMAKKRANDQKGKKGYYGWKDYWFYYDWRLDPMESADEFNSFIKDVKASTGCEKVGIMATCLGTNVAMAYIAKYGVEDIQGISFDGSVVGGAEILSEVICAKFDVAPVAVARLLRDVEGLGMFSMDDFITETIDMLVQTGALEGIISSTEDLLYDKLVAGVTSALALSTLYTWPNYWACVCPEDYEDAKYYVFGEEGSEKREKYAGLIAKLDAYDVAVRQRVPELLQKIKDGGANLGVISKYGFQMIPVCATSDAVSDQFASVTRTSFGATTSTVYDTLSDEYIAQRVAEGKARYISPDKKIDASTCIFPDYTWFVKGSSHSDWTSYELKIMLEVATADRQLTIDDFPLTQFFVYYNDIDEAEPMTEENCNTEFWTADESIDKPENVFEQIKVSFDAIIRWLKALFEFLAAKIAGG